MSNNNSDKTNRSEYLPKTILTTIFIAGFLLFIFFAIRLTGNLDDFHFTTWDLILLALATFRLGRMVAFDRVMEPFRQFFTKTVEDISGAGDTVLPRGEGLRNVIGQLISCPICIGTWIAAGLVYSLYFFPGPTRIFLTILAVVGAAEVLHALTEFMTWSGLYSRTCTGDNLEERRKNHSMHGK